MPPVPDFSADLHVHPPVDLILDNHNRIDQDAECHASGYDLRDLTPDDRSPECDSVVLHSIHSVNLRFSEPAWESGLRTTGIG